MDSEPDSTFPEGDVEVANNLIQLDDNEAAPLETKETEFRLPEKKDSREFTSFNNQSPKEKEADVSKPTCHISTDVDRCPVCVFIEYLGEVTPQPVYDILAWKDLYKTAVIFFTILPLLGLYFYCNPIVVTAYILLGLVTSTVTYRVYRYVVDSLQKSEVTHPFSTFSDVEVGNTRQAIIEWTDRILPIGVRFVNKLKHYILVNDIIDTIKFAVLLYIVAVVGAYFSVRALVILTFVGAFTLPKVFAVYKTPITTTMQQMHEKAVAATKEVKRTIRSYISPQAAKKQQ